MGLSDYENDEEPYRWIIEFAGECGPEAPIVAEVVDYFLGEHDGIPREPQFLFQLYVRLRMHREAAKTGSRSSFKEMRYDICAKISINVFLF